MCEYSVSIPQDAVLKDGDKLLIKVVQQTAFFGPVMAQSEHDFREWRAAPAAPAAPVFPVVP